MDKTRQIDKRLEPFVGNSPNHIGYSESFKSADFFMPTEKLVSIMDAFAKEIQAVKPCEKEV